MSLETHHEEFIRENAETMTIKEMASSLSTPFCRVKDHAVWHFCKKHNINFHRIGNKRKQTRTYKRTVQRIYHSANKKTTIKRPPAQYTNHSPFGIAS